MVREENQQVKLSQQLGKLACSLLLLPTALASLTHQRDARTGLTVEAEGGTIEEDETWDFLIDEARIPARDG